MDDSNYKEVDFLNYCKTCKNKDKKENENPCDECLGTPAKIDSRKPERYEELKNGRATKVMSRAKSGM